MKRSKNELREWEQNRKKICKVFSHTVLAYHAGSEE